MIFENNTIVICPNSVKKKLLLEQNKSDILLNIKYYSFNEIQKKLFFDYDEKTIYHLVEKGYSYNNAKELLDNMYYLLDNTYHEPKLKNLLDLKNELISKGLLYIDNLFINMIKEKKIYVYGFLILTKWQKKIIDILKNTNNIEIIDIWKNNYPHIVYKFNTINDEIEYIVNDIIDKKLDLNHVYIANLNSDYHETVRRIFNNYHIPINIDDNIALGDTSYAIHYLNDFNLDNIKNEDIKKQIIDVLNKYYFVNNKQSIKKILNQEFKNKKIKNVVYKNAVNVIDLFDSVINEDDYIYLIGFNKEYIPINYKDTDYIDDKIKFEYLDLTYEKNNNEIEAWLKVIENIKNIFISYSELNLNGSIKPSSLIENNFEVIKKDYSYSKYSNESNMYNLANILDNKISYNTDNHNLNILVNTYPKINYLSYDNSYKSIDCKLSNFQLSYTKLNAFYECAFKYYCNYILKLDNYEQTFDAYAGSLCHDILSHCYDDDFDFNLIKDKFLNNNPFDLTLENQVFLNKLLDELKNVIHYLHSHLKNTKFCDIECEKEVKTTIDGVDFVGFIDKIMKYNDYMVVVDYKTGDTDVDLRLCGSGLKLQLPVYIYLLKCIYPNSKIAGIYLENIISPIINFEEGKKRIDQVNDHLKLNGYTLGEEEVLALFDSSYENSEFIKSIKMTSNGFAHYSKILTQNEFNNLCDFTLIKIKDAIKEIKNANFTINPKIKGTTNMSCEFCKFKSICFTTNKDITYINNDEDLKYLEEVEND